MKGVIFNQLEAMVTEQLGAQTWETLLAETKLETQGGYFVGPKTYPDADLVALVGTASRLTGTPADDLVTAFGRYLFPGLVKMHPAFVRAGMSAKEFLLSVDRVIHVEVRKLHPDAGLPSFRYEDAAPDRLVIEYESPRKLCSLMMGLIDGVALHFGETIARDETACMKTGAKSCRVELTFATPSPTAQP